LDQPAVMQWTQDFVGHGDCFFQACDPEKKHGFADDFVFRGPIIGPLNRTDYIKTLSTFAIYEAFPDLAPNVRGMYLDPEDPLRVWFTVWMTGTHTGTWPLPSPVGPIKPTGRKMKSAPEMFSAGWTPEGKLRYLTVGYTGDFRMGTSCGYGGVFGLLCGVGMSKQKLDFASNHFGIAQWFQQFFPSNGPKSRSNPEGIPAWWKATCPKLAINDGNDSGVCP